MHDASPAPLYPDMVRQAMTSAPATLPDYRIEQQGMTWRIAVADEADESYTSLTGALLGLIARQVLAPPVFERMSFADTDPHIKRRRIRCVRRPATIEEKEPCPAY